MLGVRLERDIEARLDAIAQRTRRTKSAIVREAIGQYVRRHDTAYLAEARRQSIAAAAAEKTDELELLDRLASDIAGTT